MATGPDPGATSTPRSGYRKRLKLTLVLAASYMLAEVVGGYITNSLALLADAGHMLTDVAALALALFAMWIAERPPTPRHSFGYYRAEILAALANGATLVAIALFIFVEAIDRFRDPPTVNGPMMMGIAAGGLLINAAGLYILRGGRNESLNVRGAWLHVLTDLLGSVQAIAAGALIWAFGWNWVDPAVSMLIGLLVIYSSWALLKESTAVLMESAPAGINVEDVRNSLMSVPSVRSVHDLHVWTITSGMVSLAAHVTVEKTSESGQILLSIRSELKQKHGIEHSTIQFEEQGFVESEAPV